jgi:hypothetical protein
LGTAADPLGEGAPGYGPYPVQAYRGQPYQPYPGQPYPYQQAYYRPTAYNQENYNEASRQIPYSGYSSSDPVGDVRLRGGY